MSALGFGKATNIFPSGSGETSGYFPALQNWVTSTPYYIPIGQGFSVTPIQLLRAGTALVNGGKLLRPFVAWRIRSPGDNKIFNEQQVTWEKSPFEKSVNQKVRKMMKRVVKAGTGTAAQIKSVGAIGKTGTGEKSSAHGYLDRYVTSFIGFFPEKSPKYSVLILLDEPETAHSGGTLAAPIFSRFVSRILPSLNTRTHSLYPKNLPPLAVKNWKVNPNRLYDFRGLATREATQILNEYYKVEFKLKGNGYVYKQTPPPRTNIKKVKKILLYLNELH